MADEEARKTGQDDNEDRKEREDTGRDSKGRFGPKNRGRPRGAKGVVTRAVEKLLFDAAPDAAKTLRQKAAAGHVQAAIAIVRHLVAPPRERAATVRFRLPKLESAKDALAALNEIARGIERGELDGDSVKILTELVREFRATLDIVELEERIAEIEANEAEEPR